MAEIVKKTYSNIFENVLSGKKNFDVRIENDCKFNEGDVLVLKEVNYNGNFTGREIRKSIKYILKTKEQKFWKKEDIDKFGFTVLGFD